jgi:hypothetical protein
MTLNSGGFVVYSTGVLRIHIFDLHFKILRFIKTCPLGRLFYERRQWANGDFRSGV